jgi:hypothetical protein
VAHQFVLSPHGRLFIEEVGGSDAPALTVLSRLRPGEAKIIAIELPPEPE